MTQMIETYENNTALEDRLENKGHATDFLSKGYIQIVNKPNSYCDVWAKIEKTNGSFQLEVAHTDFNGTERIGKFNFQKADDKDQTYKSIKGILHIRNFKDETDWEDSYCTEKEYVYHLQGKKKFNETLNMILCANEPMRVLMQNFSKSNEFMKYTNEMSRIFDN